MNVIQVRAGNGYEVCIEPGLLDKTGALTAQVSKAATVADHSCCTGAGGTVCAGCLLKETDTRGTILPNAGKTTHMISKRVYSKRPFIRRVVIIC